MSAAYTRPSTLEAAVEALATTDDARPIAGGTDLMIQLRLGKRSPSLVVDLSKVDELRGISTTPDGGLRLGAGTTMRELLARQEVRAGYTALRDAADLLGGRQVQAMATIGGNLCNASPAAESATPLLVHDAEVEIAGPGYRRTVPLTDFWAGPGATVLAQGELVTAVTLPAPAGRSAYRRLDLRRSVDIAVVGASARLQLGDGRVTEVRLAIGAAAPTARRVPEAEAAVAGVDVDALPGAIEEAGRRARSASLPIDDTRASAAYRTAMVEVMVVRALTACR